MQFMLLLWAPEQMPEGDYEPDLEPWWAYERELKAAGAHVVGEALQPSQATTVVRVQDGERLVTDGPFAETKEQVAGFYLLDCPDLDSALGWAAKCPIMQFGGTIEVRPVMSFDPAPAA